MCDHCERSYSEVEYDDLQTVCGCGHLITSPSHVLPVRWRLTKKQSLLAGSQSAFPHLDYSFQTQGKQSKPVQIGKHFAHHSVLAPTSRPALAEKRYRRKTTPVCTSAKWPLLSASCVESGILIKGATHLPVEAEHCPTTPSLPKKRSIDQVDETQKDVHIKKPRCSLPQSENWQATPSSPKKRSIDRVFETRTDIHIKKPRCSLPRLWCAGGA